MTNNIEAGLIFFLVIFVLAAILVYVFYLLNLQRLLNEVSPNNRLVPPTNVWYMFIPFFNIVYPFILYPKICDSVKNEYQARGLAGEGDFGKGIGITMPILTLVGLIPVIGGLAGIVNLVLLIVFWVKMSGYKSRLMTMPKADGDISSNSDLLD